MPRISHYNNINKDNKKSYIYHQPSNIYLIYFSREYILILILPFKNILKSILDYYTYNLAIGKYRWKDRYKDSGQLKSSYNREAVVLLAAITPYTIEGTNGESCGGLKADGGKI
ncbi:unnamed protein product [Clonostachys solani]|uniref:Uncharacterized protein n=1 Tax=Clonostachys solani TaxID=160281 RepID=A0A9N9ZD28_9HYPO|nr:unnamed protein product [Clonostachys solani]